MRKLVVILVFLGACQSPKPQKEIPVIKLGVALKENYPKLLSEWELFSNTKDYLVPKKGVFPYEINSPLFTDYAHKARFIRLPANQPMAYNETEVLGFPDSTVLVKHFYYPADFNKPDQDLRILETRLLVKDSLQWNALVYRWNEEQTDAKRLVTGADIPIEWTDENGELQRINYSIPSQPQCKSCHEFNGKIMPIGPSARQLNRDNQLQDWHTQGLVDLPEGKLPKLVSYFDSEETLNARARAWLEINCAHCHRKEGPAKNTGLYLMNSEKDPYKLGVNKPPVAAGRGSGGHKYSIVPGNPEESILVHRIESLEPGEMMPELGRKLQHTEGIELIRAWVADMESK